MSKNVGKLWPEGGGDLFSYEKVVSGNCYVGVLIACPFTAAATARFYRKRF